MSFSTAALRARIGAAVRPLQGWPNRAAKVKDALLVLVLVPPVLLEVLGMRWANGASAALVATEAVAAVLVLTVVVPLARPYPLPALAVSILAVLWLSAFTIVLMVVAYLAGRRMPDPRPALALFGAIVLIGVPLAVLVSLVEPVYWVVVVGTFAFNAVFPWGVGLYRRQRRELLLAGWERAERLEREQRIVADQARLRERSRIAQDMHDSLGHELSLIALRAGALEVDPDNSGRVRRAASELRENATTATERLSEIIGVLRDDTEPVPMEPVGEDVSTLVDRARDSGMTVTLIRRGDPAGLSHMTDRAVYRIVQEALTNANKHAHGAAVSVELTHTPDQVRVRVVNSAPPPGPVPEQGGGRRGLIGLGERARLVGGVLRAGEHEGGWLLEARLPARGEHTEVRDGDLPGPRTEQSRTTRYYHQARRRVRWGLLALIGIPGAGVAVLAAIVVGTLLVEEARSTRLAERFAELRIGESEAEVRRRLPEAEPESLPGVHGPLPEGWECVHYWSRANPINQEHRVYRVCFEDGVLVAKEETTL